MAKYVEPSIRATAFSCPHCGAFTTQYWFTLYAMQIEGDDPVPTIPSEARLQKFAANPEIAEKDKKSVLTIMSKMLSGHIFFEKMDSVYSQSLVMNLHVSMCYNCQKIAAWVHDSLLFPRCKSAVEPNQDLPEEIARDFNEAREIVDSSPRSAAGLLRLCIQKLCRHLGEKGKDINEDIGSLVKKGLNPLVQQSLDIVRVIGNEAVHPGVIDLNDDRDTAFRLFDLVNAIAEQMISVPKSVNEMYNKLPHEKRAAIEKRDGPAKP